MWLEDSMAVSFDRYERVLGRYCVEVWWKSMVERCGGEVWWGRHGGEGTVGKA